MHVVLCKDEEAAETYLDTLNSEGHTVSFVQPLGFKPHVDRVRQAITSATSCRAFVVTSKRAASVLVDALQTTGFAARIGSETAIYALGFATCGVISAAGVPCEGSNCKSATELADRLVMDFGKVPTAVACQPTGQPTVLFLCGDKRLDVLPHALKAATIHCDEVVAYETVPAGADDIRVAWDRAVPGPSSSSDGEAGSGDGSSVGPPALVFFSPSGVHAVLACPRAAAALRDKPGVDGSGQAQAGPRVRAVALGNTTAAALRDAGVPVAAVAPTPDAAGVAAAVRALSAG